MALKTKKAGRPAEAERAEAPANSGDFFPTAWLLASYALIAVVFYLPALMPGMMIYGSDHLSEAYFSELFATQRLAAGELPKWNPYIYGGIPFYSNAMDTYYPVTVLARLVGVPTHHLPLANFIVQTFLAGLGVFLLVRAMGGRRVAAYLSGLAYMFSGYVTSFILGGHDGRMIVATLAPLFFYAIHRSVECGGLRWYLLAGVVLGGAHLSNQIQSTYYMLLGGFAWFAFLLWHLGAVRPARVLANRVGGAALAIVVGFALAAVNYLPFLGYVEHSPRGGEGGRGYEFATSWSMPPEEITGLAVPEHFGILEAYWGENPFKLHTEYAGGFALIALVVGVYLLRRNRYTWFFVGLAGLGLTMSFGGHTPIYRLYYALLPGVDKFRAPSISFYLVILAICAIAALALDRLASLREERRRGRAASAAASELAVAVRIGLVAVGIVIAWGIVAAASGGPVPATMNPSSAAAVAGLREAANHPAYVAGVWRFAVFFGVSAAGLWLWVRGRLPTRAFGVLLAVITVADLWIIDKKFLRAIPGPEVTLARDEIATFLMDRPAPARVFVLPGMRQGNYLTQFGIELVTGDHPNPLESYHEFLGAGASAYTDLHNVTSDPRFLALSNARYLVVGGQLDAPFLRPVFQGRSYTGQPAYVYENTQVLPRAFVVPSATRVAGAAEALAWMRSDAFDPTREVVLYVDPPVPAADTAGFSGTARVERHEPSIVEVAVQASDSSYLVLTDNYYEGWDATIDGEPVPVLQADLTFRAVPVPAGEHVVRFEFRPTPLRAGALISGGTWLLLLVYGGTLLVRRHRARPEEA